MSMKMKSVLVLHKVQISLCIFTLLLNLIPSPTVSATSNVPDDNLGKAIDLWPNSDPAVDEPLKAAHDFGQAEADATVKSDLSLDSGNSNVNISGSHAGQPSPTLKEGFEGSKEKDEYDYEKEEEGSGWMDDQYRRGNHHRTATVMVYCSVILIALVGVLIKYFVTQYETAQAKAQLEYQQLRNSRC